ncbi:type I-B CRISPR-associated protein Cas7/Csh2 [Thermodesulfovibrio sp. 3907-1M]|uniref:Type I-B CRISPR-associated protein Cas7/Csh2 n=1 Tax=Thermodesulfovibrio autotrophicus TaxID=3118333 RepID=A0AAU8GYU2_9BACT
MSEIIKNRSEILFLYDVKDANPNGDPVDENKPRIDEETGVNIVTDVRLKRTIRDYFLSLVENKDVRLKDEDIFVKERRDEEGFLYDAKTRAKEFLHKEGKFQEMRDFIKEDICKKCIDVRLFGAVIPLDLKVQKGSKMEANSEQQEKEKEKSGSITLTGPVQFKFGRSIHKVDGPVFIKGTGAFADKYDEKNKKLQFTFREEYVLPYSLICFYGIVNENVAKNTELKQSDIELLLEGIWIGTKNLISRSKFGQMPRFLMQIVYKEGQNFHIGELDKLISLKSEIPDEAIRDISDVKIDVSELLNVINKHKDKIEKIRIKVDDRVQFIKDDKETDLKTALNGFTIEELTF